MVTQFLPYSSDVRAYFQAIRHLPWACWLDSGNQGNSHGRYDILVADPYKTLVYAQGKTRIANREGEQGVSDGPPLRVVRELMGEPVKAAAGIPFAGGAVGYFSYDFGVDLEIDGVEEELSTLDDNRLPEIALGIYDWAIVVDHAQRKALLASQGSDPATQRTWERLLRMIEQETAKPPPPSKAGFQEQPACNMSREFYGAAFRRIQHYLREGDCYQVNFAQAFRVPFTGDPWQLYQTMRARNPAPYGAYLQLPFAQILSSSPEQFLGLRNGQATTRPIKGTRPRSADEHEDLVLAGELQQSKKDRAENLMIVDLLRNDLGRVCRPGTIQVPKLFAIESFATVHHLVSTITGELGDGEDALSLLQACFPGGSITGAPKHRAMEIIRELEPEPRQVYCGSIGWIGFDGNMDSNIAIRTLLLKDGVATYWAGGGIVADSEEEAEYQESLDKASAFFDLAD